MSGMSDRTYSRIMSLVPFVMAVCGIGMIVTLLVGLFIV